MSDRTPTMTHAERRARQMRILDQLRSGLLPSTVAKREGLSTDHVRQIGLNGGLGERTEDRPSSVWEMTEAERRVEFALRESRGARKTLRAAKKSTEFSPLSPQPTAGA